MPTNPQIPAFQALLTPAGQRLLGELDATAIEADPLAAATRVRRRVAELDAGLDGVPEADVAGAAITQARLRGRAREKFDEAAAEMYFTPDGLEQATRAEVARYRAGHFAAALGPGARVTDLCCGIGADLAALARAGLTVEGIDADPLTVAVANANLAALGLAERARAREGDAAAATPEDTDAVFCDPARRGGRGRVFDPRAYSPPWDTVLGLATRAPAAVVKAAPGLPHEAIPDGAAVEWVSVRGEVKEAMVRLGGLAEGPPRRATLLRGAYAPPATLAADPDLGDPPVAAAGRYLYEPDGAVVRAHLVAEAAAAVDGALLDPRIAYITSDRLVDTPFCRSFEIETVLPFSVKRLRAALRERAVGTVTIKKRGSAVDVEKLRRDLRPSGPESAVVVLTRVGERPVCLLCTEVRTPAENKADISP